MTFTTATYVSVWDGSTEVRTHCEIDVTQNPPAVTNVETVDAENHDSLDEEYIEFHNGEQIRTFTVDETYVVKDGSLVEDFENPIY